MLLTLATTHRPAIDLGFLLRKNPANVHSRALPCGQATLFYPEASADRCVAALTLEVDPIDLVRSRARARGQQGQYVSDRPYAVSSLMSVAIGKMLSSALAGRSAERQDLAQTAIPLEATLTPCPLGGEAGMPSALLSPLGYAVEVIPIPYQVGRPDWGTSTYGVLKVSGRARLADLLHHLRVIIPVLDDAKHYFVGEDEVRKLLQSADPWLAVHPQRDLIVKRSLRHIGSLVRMAQESLDTASTTDAENEKGGDGPAPREPVLKDGSKLNEVRYAWVKKKLLAHRASNVVDLGCGEGRLLDVLAKERLFSRVVGVDVSIRSLERAAVRLRLEPSPESRQKKVQLLHGSMVYRDGRLRGFDAAVAIEVIEHFEPERLPALAESIFGYARPKLVIITTPNSEYNTLMTGLAKGQMRHADHRFEWNRKTFQAWADEVARTHGYSVEVEGIGPTDATLGTPTQAGVFWL